MSLAPERRGSACEKRSLGTELWLLNLFSLSPVNGVIADMEEFLCLCLVFLRDVKLSSSGFMSGGRLEIFRKTMSRYRSSTSESRCRPATTTDVSQVVVRTLFVSSSVGNMLRQRPSVPASISELRRDINTVNEVVDSIETDDKISTGLFMLAMLGSGMEKLVPVSS
jgi:hypothetical protein